MKLIHSPLILLLLLLTQLARAQPPVLDIHFAVITKNENAKTIATKRQLKKEVDILNRYFVNEDGDAIVKFQFKSASLYSDIENSDCEFVRLGDTKQKYSSNGWAKKFNACNDPKVKNPKSINFYVYDSYSSKKQFTDKTSHGKRNSNRPYVLIDWARLNHKHQSPEEHEMGHALGLKHVCVPGAKIDTPTNIMASAACGKGSGGRRNIGFNRKQVATILSYIVKIIERQERI